MDRICIITGAGQPKYPLLFNFLAKILRQFTIQHTKPINLWTYLHDRFKRIILRLRVIEMLSHTKQTHLFLLKSETMY